MPSRRSRHPWLSAMWSSLTAKRAGRGGARSPRSRRSRAARDTTRTRSTIAASTSRARVARLVDFCKELTGDLVLVGSSLGGYVAVTSASLLHARGGFLLAPALYLE